MVNNNDTIPTKFHPALIALHWLMLVLIVGAYVTMEFSDVFPKDSPERIFMKTTHFSLGMSILFLVVVRIAVRLTTQTPPIVPAPNAKQELLAKLMHLAIYVFMFAMPILGWLILSSHGKSVPFWGLQIPAIMGENKEIGHLFHELHEVGATVGYFLLGLHAAAGLFHHYKMRDNTLLRMSFLKK